MIADACAGEILKVQEQAQTVLDSVAFVPGAA